MEGFRWIQTIAFILLVQSLQRTECSRTETMIESVITFLRDGARQIVDEPIDRSDILKRYDFIIVGAGTAGCTLANRLTEIEGWKVLLIEAGNRENFLMDIPLAAHFLQHSPADWEYKTMPSKRACVGFNNNQCNWPRGKVMGGSSVLNYMIYTRGHRNDYDLWEKMGNKGWSWRDILPYFKKVENFRIDKYNDVDYHSQNGYLDVSYIPYRTKTAQAWVNSAREMGYKIRDMNGKRATGVDFLQVSLSNGTRHSASRAYLHPIKNRQNLHVVKRSMVTKLLNEGSKIIGVEFLRDNKTYRIMARKEVIVSAGAVNSPQLLMLSGIGPKKHLRDLGINVIKDLRVGYNLMDHIAAGGLSFTLNRQNFSLTLDEIFANNEMIYDWLNYHNGPLSIPGGCEAVVFADTENPQDDDGWPDIELLFVGGSMNGDSAFKSNFGFRSDLYEKVYSELGDQQSFMVFPMLLRPKSKGRVMLKNADPLTHPSIYPNYFAHKYDVATMVTAIKEAIKIAEQSTLKKMGSKLYSVPIPGCAHLGFGSDSYWACHAKHFTFTIYHASGTCKMGPKEDATSVVDSRLKVHGVKGLRVIDASIMPEIPAAHTNAPTYMIAEKGADMIKEDWGKL